MSLPPALLQRLAQRGLVQKPKSKIDQQNQNTAENEEVIAEDYDEMDPSQYEPNIRRKPAEENFWLERMRARISTSSLGYKGCPNKYNIWHKCTLYCVNRWAEGRPEPSRDYLKRFKRLKGKYPLPNGWSEMYDPGCGCFYFCNVSENLVSWLPPTHPKSQVTKSAATIRLQMDEQAGGEGAGGSDGERSDDNKSDDGNDADESAERRHHREVDEIITASLRAGRRSPAHTTVSVLGSQDFPSLQEAFSTGVRKSKNRDLERTLSRQSRRDRDGRYSSRRQAARDLNPLDPMDPSSYSDLPRGSWSDGLNVERKKVADERNEAPSHVDDERDDDAGGRCVDNKNSKELKVRRRRSPSRQSDGSHEDEHHNYE